jgi:hypothetical protein
MDVARDHSVAGFAQRPGDVARTGGTFPNRVRNLLNAKQRLDGDGRRLVEIESAL